ncbi:transcriptional regulator [Mesorhizobium sp. NBSH29]|uniref:dimethylsulfoniopropionate lyase n=1 Tax=Mesorhizobium sp. NBSH29 TaxID=2654249 RepID=UPI0018BF951E|nr:dimethylsulfoniopropionate lyase [Mesorhizobium sp. NBSH29]QPC88070.1 transcriptional regulator [Mesorhizobium sp. NBSH29]
MTANFEELRHAFRSFLLQTPSSPVRSFMADIDWEMKERRLHSRPLACLKHLPRAVDSAAGSARELAQRLACQAAALAWGQTYTAQDFGPDFLDKYGWTELFGTRGHFRNDRIAGGFLLLGPGVVYPDHHHVAEEIYIPLTGGTEWRMDDGDFVPRAGGEVIHHRSNANHAMRTGAAPLLALYLWRGGDLAQRSVIDVGREAG